MDTNKDRMVINKNIMQIIQGTASPYWPWKNKLLHFLIMWKFLSEDFELT